MFCGLLRAPVIPHVQMFRTLNKQQQIRVVVGRRCGRDVDRSWQEELLAYAHSRLFLLVEQVGSDFPALIAGKASLISRLRSSKDSSQTSIPLLTISQHRWRSPTFFSSHPRRGPIPPVPAGSGRAFHLAHKWRRKARVCPD
jgi:hypothetical protein